MQLNPDQLDAARTALLSSSSDDLIDVMFRLNRQMPLRTDPSPATKLGWIDEPPLGWLVADSIREYRLWLDRDKRIHAELDYDLLSTERYSGKAVLEPGSGFGCNLLSLSRVPGRFVGLEPVAVYRQLTSIFAEREGLPTPEVIDGKCETLPFSKEQFDIVLVYSAHQYMDIRQALREMARVLRPGGQVQIIGGTLDAYLLTNPAPRRLGQLRDFIMTVGNTISYELTGHRAVTRAGATGTPIYPRHQYMNRWMNEAGLTVREDLCRQFNNMACFVADKST